MLPEGLLRYRSQIQDELKTIVNDHPSPLENVLRYHLGWSNKSGVPGTYSSGKLVRASLCLMCCRAFGQDIQKALPAAASVELVHCFSLIHDDIEDKSEERHHRQSVWKIWGEAQAINVGDAAYALSHLALLRLRDIDTEESRLVRCFEELDTATLRLCEGQFLDMAFESKPEVSLGEYLTMVSGKTAALLSSTTAMGGILGMQKIDDNTIENLRRFGYELGLAYQIRDDILGIWGKENNTGKPVSDDIIRRKKSFPVVYGLQQSGRYAELLGRFYREYTDESDPGSILSALARLGARKHAEIACDEHVNRALEYMTNIGLDSANLKEIEELVNFLAKREC